MRHLLFAFLVLGLGLFVACGNNTASEADSSTEESTDMMEEKMDATDAATMEVDSTGPEFTSMYICPMHCKGSGSSEPGKCPVCGMDYVVNENFQADADMPADHSDDHEGHDHEGHEH